MGPYQGGQAVSPPPTHQFITEAHPTERVGLTQEYVKVPFADFNALKLPPGTEHEDDFALLSDIFPTVSRLTHRAGFEVDVN